jgi:6-phosphogluconolactonase (cycloisomerase 2 family)
MAIEPTGKFAYVTNVASWNVSAFSINASGGALTPVNVAV